MNKSTEATASVSYTVKTPSGHNVIFTMRADDELELLGRMETVENYFVDNGFNGGPVKSTPEFDPKTPTKEEDLDLEDDKPVDLDSNTCPKCGEPLVKFSSKDGTKSGMKCSTSGWDREAKKAIGCDYVKWNKDPARQMSLDDKVTPAQKNLLIKLELWEEGLTKAQAHAIISKATGK
jgi:hypothetical protein